MPTTVKQRAFAKLVATGMPKSEAYDKTYGKNGGKDRTRRITASKVSLQPEVAAEIARFEQLLAPIEDWAALRREMLQNIRWLALEARDERVRMAAALDLRNYADERAKQDEQRRERRGPITLDGLIHEIKQLEAPEPTVELEATADGAPAEAAQPEPEESE